MNQPRFEIRNHGDRMMFAVGVDWEEPQDWGIDTYYPVDILLSLFFWTVYVGLGKKVHRGDD